MRHTTFVFTLLAATLQFCVTDLFGQEKRATIEDIKMLHDAADQTYKSLSSYSSMLNTCVEIQEKLNAAKIKEKNKSRLDIIDTWLNLWQSRVVELAEQKKQLLDTLYALMERKARRMAQDHHPASNIEEFVPAPPVENQEEDVIRVWRSFAVRMRGAFFGKNIFKFNVKLEGIVDLNNKKVLINEDKSDIEE